MTSGAYVASMLNDGDSYYTVNLKLKHDVFLYPRRTYLYARYPSPDQEILGDPRSSFDYSISGYAIGGSLGGGYVCRYCKFKGDVVSLGPYSIAGTMLSGANTLDLAIIETKGSSETVAKQKIYTDTVFYSSYDGYLSYECDVIQAASSIMSTDMAYGSLIGGNKSCYLTNGCDKNLDKGYYLNKGTFTRGYERYIIPQSDPIPGIYNFKTYDLSSLINNDTSTADKIYYNIPSEFQDYISATSFYSEISLYSWILMGYPLYS